MSKKFQLQIPEPCHENWDKMTPVDKGRFCDSCQKAVVDFTGMGDLQLVAFFKKPSTGSVCGRFFNDQLERDFEIPRKRLPWIKYFFQLLIPAFLVSSKAKSQGKPRLIGDTVLVESKKILKHSSESCDNKPDTNKLQMIKGRLIDEKNQGIAFASVQIKGTTTGVVADVNGNFSINPFLDRTRATLVFSSVGFETKEIIVDTTRTKSLCNIGMVPMRSVTSGVIIVGIVSRKKKKESFKIIQRIFKDTASKFFRTYPNPVSSGSLLKLELNKAGLGEYLVDLINMSGQVVHSSNVVFDSEKQINSLLIPPVVTGTYFVHLENKKTGKKHSEKIIIH